MRVLVTGAAGYVGSHAVKHLLEHDHDVVAVDNLLRGHRAAVAQGVPFYALDILDTNEITRVLLEHKIECVMHFAALTYVDESVKQPLRYYRANVAGTASVLDAVDAANVRRFVFSSTAATYGEPDTMPITEDTPANPINPYGRSKLMVEQMLRDYADATPAFGFAALRYFNVAGCASDGSLGEVHSPETHLIPLLLLAAMGKRDGFTIFGNDYPTADGTCIRDFVHVEDLAVAHTRTMQAIQPGDQRFYNLATGRGYSIRQVIESVKRVTGKDIDISTGPRRAGDPPSLFASADRIQNELGWRAEHTDLDQIIATAWRWFQSNPDGYA